MPTELPASTREPVLTLSYGEQTIKLGPAWPSALLGREASNDLAIKDNMASRVHCKIEYRRREFFLVDQSTNGTYVKLGGDAEILLKREQLLLRGSGVFCLGASSAAAGAKVVTFALS